MTAGIIIDDYKLPVFERKLKEAGYTYTTAPGLTADMLILRVEAEDASALHQLILAANLEATSRKPTTTSEVSH